MSLFDHDNYRDFIKTYLKALPKRGHGQARKMAEHLSVSSTYMSQILSGVKQLTAEQGDALTQYLGLSGIEADYFFYLVQKERAGTKKLRSYCEQKLEQIKTQAQKLSSRVDPKKVLSDEEKAVFYSNALYSAVHLYTSTGDKGRSFEDIIERFDLSRSKASAVIDFLKSAQLVVEEAGRLKMGTQSTHVGVDSPFLLQHLTNWHLQAVSAAADLNEAELMYSSNVSLSKKDFEKLREKMVLFIKDFLKEVHASPADEIACFNMDFFWVRK